MTIHNDKSFHGTPLRTVLVVDDMEANRAVISRRLKKMDYIVSCVESGAAALLKLKQGGFDIVLLDYMMPQMNGIEVLRELRADAAMAELPVIMVTARAESEAIVEALAAGADDYVTKPIDFDVLKARIETLLNKRSDAAHLKRANAALDERITMRSMVLADLECELKDEIRRRHELEKKLAIAASEPQPGARAVGAARPRVRAEDCDLATLLEEISEGFDVIFAAVTSGRTVNLAQMAELKGLLTRAQLSVRS